MTAATITTENAAVVAQTVIAPPLALYLHLPWCLQKCPYCDFNSHKAPQTLPEDAYINALLTDAEHALPEVWGRRIVSLYLGGGTPSLFSPESLDKLFAGLRALFNIAPDTEVTMEANPGAADAGRFAEYRALGISRLSLGAQSFNDAMLKSIGRIHDAKQARNAAQKAAQVFDNVNIDLMHALPAQTIKGALEDANIAMSFAPQHLSMYQLTLEPGTPFHRAPPPQLPNEDDTAAAGEALIKIAEDNGYARYEVSAYARAGYECAHNLNYWRFGDYLGIGAGAHGKITANGKIKRQSRVKHPGDYMRRVTKGAMIAEQKHIGGREAVFEYMLNALRLTEGFAPADMHARTGMTTSTIERALQTAEREKMITRTPSRITTTPFGMRFLNDLLALFLPPPAKEGDAP